MAGVGPGGCASEDPDAGREPSYGSSAPPTPANRGEQGHGALLERFQALLADPERVAGDLRSGFAAVSGAEPGASCRGRRLRREDALRVLSGTLAQQLAGLPSVGLGQAKWRGLLKKAGVYGTEDLIGFDELLQLYMQTLGSLRDCFAPCEVLRGMRCVPRSGTRLKDRYDSFEFGSKDVLGKVYRCRDILTRDARCCRQIRKDKASVPIDRIRLYLTQLEELDHPSIPAVVEWLEDFHNFYVISAPPEGVELLDFVQAACAQAKDFTEVWVSSVLRQVLEAVAYCHAQPRGPVMHRDLRPECVLVLGSSEGTAGRPPGRSPSVFIPGFGLQAMFDLHGVGASLPPDCLPADPPGAVVSLEAMPSSSAPEFLAPEVWRRDFGPRCDVWACGCLMFLLLTGSAPFDPKRPIHLLVRDILDEEPDWQLFRNVSTSALSLCRRMLSRDDSERPTAAECLRHPWLAAAGVPERLPRELRSETVSSLMRFHAQTKFCQVLMNVVATEFKVGRLRRVRETLARLDAKGAGALAGSQLQVALTELGVAPQTAEQALSALDPDGAGQIPYALFMAGCVDLVDDKLDHMLWKVFAMVDEDHGGEISAVVLAHFLHSVVSESDGPGGSGDVERYLHGVIGDRLPALEVVSRVASGRTTLTFEEVKKLVLDCADDTTAGAAGRVDAEVLAAVAAAAQAAVAQSGRLTSAS